MKGRLPIVLLAIGILVVLGVVVKLRNQNQMLDDNGEVVTEIPFDKRPFVSLTPKSDGHWLVLKISSVEVPNAATVDYELFYEVPDPEKPPQGVPGTVQIEAGKPIERELLLGSESSGKYRYDEGVENGTLTLRFRNEDGKLVGKLVTDFHMQTNTRELTLGDEFAFTLDNTQRAYFVTMNTFGLPKPISEEVMAGPFGIFGSDATKYSGKVTTEGKFHMFDGNSWSEVGDKASIGVFVKSS